MRVRVFFVWPSQKSADIGRFLITQFRRFRWRVERACSVWTAPFSAANIKNDSVAKPAKHCARPRLRSVWWCTGRAAQTTLRAHAHWAGLGQSSADRAYPYEKPMREPREATSMAAKLSGSGTKDTAASQPSRSSPAARAATPARLDAARTPCRTVRARHCGNRPRSGRARAAYLCLATAR